MKILIPDSIRIAMRPLLATYQANLILNPVAYSQLLLSLDSSIEDASANKVKVVTVRIQ